MVLKQDLVSLTKVRTKSVILSLELSQQWSLMDISDSTGVMLNQI